MYFLVEQFLNGQWVELLKQKCDENNTSKKDIKEGLESMKDLLSEDIVYFTLENEIIIFKPSNGPVRCSIKS